MLAFLVTLKPTAQCSEKPPDDELREGVWFAFG